MPVGVNSVHLLGHLGRDPELRYAQSGTAVANATLATTERRKDRDGNWGDHTEWHRLVFFGKTAETLARYCKKGKQLFIEGSLQTRKWEKDGHTNYSTEIRVSNMVMLGGRDGEERGAAAAASAGGGSSAGDGDQGAYAESEDDDLPFISAMGVK